MSATKQCRDCEGTYPIEFFQLYEKNTKGYRFPRCKSCDSARNMGITGIVPFKPPFEKCAVCLNVFPREKLKADHAHTTFWKLVAPCKSHKEGRKLYKGPFRAWLCGTCNVRVGYFECDPELYKRTQEYVNNDALETKPVKMKRSLEQLTTLYKDLHKRARLLNEQH